MRVCIGCVQETILEKMGCVYECMCVCVSVCEGRNGF